MKIRRTKIDNDLNWVLFAKVANEIWYEELYGGETVLTRNGISFEGSVF